MKTKIFFFCAILLPVSMLFAQNTFLWRIENPENSHVSYLNGTNHVLTSTYLETFPLIKEKISASEAVVFETDLRDTQAIENYYSRKPVNEELKKLLTNEQLEKLEKRFGPNITKTSPANVYSQLGGLYLRAEKDSVKVKVKKKNIEESLFEMADEMGKTIITLETVDAQLEAVDRIKPSILVYGLMKKSIPGLVDDMDNPDRKIPNKDSAKKVVKEHYDGQVDYYLDSKCRGQYQKNLLVDRNNNWMKKLPGILDSKNVFISVGLMHLQYKCGLVSQLRDAGYKLTPVDMKTGKDLPF